MVRIDHRYHKYVEKVKLQFSFDGAGNTAWGREFAEDAEHGPYIENGMCSTTTTTLDAI